MTHIKFSYPDEFERTVDLTQDEFEHHIRLMAALKMFELGKLSAARASEFSGMTKAAFLDACATYHISPYNISEAALETEIREDLDTLDNL
jgi:predicted HTH domain antitoxin